MASGAVVEMWTVKDVMRLLNVKKSWVYAHVDSGDLPHYRLSGHIRFEPKDVLAYRERCKVKKAKVISISSTREQ